MKTPMMTAISNGIAVDLVAEQEATHGGISRYVDRMRASLAELNVDVRLTPFRYLPGSRKRPILKALPIGIRGKRQEAITHIPQIMGASVLLIPRAAHGVVVTVHDLGALYCPEDKVMNDALSRQLFWLSLQGMKRAQHVIAVSEFTRQGVIRAGFHPDHVTTIHRSIDLDQFRPIPNAAEALEGRYRLDLSSRPVVLYVGNEFPRKNLVTLIRALGRLRRGGLRTHWIKVGQAGYAAGRDALQEAILEEGLSNDTTFLERIMDDDLARFYSAASVYVQPSVWEGFGLPVLEAMACGTPVVASRAAALPEVGGDAVTLVDPLNAEELATAIDRLISDRALHAEHRARGVSQAMRFSWRSEAERSASVYAKVAAQIK
jgi:glycosyltransferase involved in cell wall biosynthesis